MSEQAIVAKKTNMGPKWLPEGEKVKKFSMSLYPDEIQYVEDYKNKKKLRRFSNALRTIILEHKADRESKK